MLKFILTGLIFVFLSACNSGGSGDQGSDTSATGGGDPSQGSGAGGNTNNIGTDTMRTITTDTTGRDTSRRDTMRWKRIYNRPLSDVEIAYLASMK